MDELDKINIYVPERIGRLLDKDTEMFEVFKKDGSTINRNRFLSKLILGYYNSYVYEHQQAYDKIVKNLTNYGIETGQSHEIADIIMKNIVLPEVPSRKGKNPSKLSLKPTKETEGLIRDIMKDIGGDDHISQYFCKMLMSYAEKPFYERERIIFRDNYELLEDACRQVEPITFSTIWNPKKTHTVIPFCLAVGQAEMFNYLLCAETNPETGIQEAATYRLNRIGRIYYKEVSNQISEDVREYIKQMLTYGPEYAINDNEECCVKLTATGKKRFGRIYHGRPRVDRIEKKEDGYYYYFKGSKYQVSFYFRRFGFEDAEIISPEYLRNEMKEFHQKAYGKYK